LVKEGDYVLKGRPIFEIDFEAADEEIIKQITTLADYEGKEVSLPCTAHIDYSKRNVSGSRFYHEGGYITMGTATVKTGPQREKRILTRRIGATTYRVGMHYSKTSHESFDDKVIRLIRNDSIGRKVVRKQ